MATVKDKADHVRQATQTRVHACHWTGCTAQVPPAMAMCRKHWYKLPMALRSRIWAAYRVGQEDTRKPSPAYVKVMRDALDWITKEGNK